MASQGSNSRLTQMQMRFQQKQQQEREQKKSDIAATRPINSLDSGDTKNILNSSIGAGKVRQMFDERRHRVTGIDKSYPLQPIQTSTTAKSTNSSSSNDNNNNLRSTTIASKRQLQKPMGVGTVVGSINKQATLGNAAPLTTASRTINSKPRVPPLANRRKVETDKMPSTLSKKPIRSDVPQTENIFDYEHSASDKQQSMKLSNVGKLPSKNLNNINILNNNFNEMILNDKEQDDNHEFSLPNKLKAKTPTTASPKANSKSSSKFNSINSTPTKQTQPTARGMSAASSDNENGTSAVSVVPSGMKACSVCGRHFNEDRVAKHEAICIKTANKKRKSFNSVQHRVMGTEAANYILKPNKGNSKSKARSSVLSDIAKKNDWRKKHEEFIQAIRAAKELKAHLARGGKLSDLPPPPVSENADYIQCPHCERRFNQNAAERHIPKCATMLHNKPKKQAAPAAAKRRY